MIRRLFCLAYLAGSIGTAWAEEAVITPQMLRPFGTGYDLIGFQTPDVTGLPILRADRTDPAARLLRVLAARGDINGHQGILYDNRDRGHSTLRPGAYPSLVRTSYGPGFERRDHGLSVGIGLPGIVIGNSSMAVTGGSRPRSLPRLAMTTPVRSRQAYSDYINNRLYLHPEHRDHDAADLFPANWPFTVTSQGSSGSDKPFLHAFLMTLAAMDPETLRHMEAEGLTAPTLQMLMRRNLRGINSLAEYYSAAAHPPVFDGPDLRVERMMSQAADLRPDTLPPMVRLSVLEDGFANAAGLMGRSEHLFTTPAALARLWRGFEAKKRMVVSTHNTLDPAGRDLTYRWVLLRGDPAKVLIRPFDNGTQAEIEIAWHDAFDVPGPEGMMTTSRVDIGVFAEVAGVPSAPSMISVHFPTHQTRRYSTAPDGTPRLDSIDYDALSRNAPYDPTLYWSAFWRDEALWDSNGTLSGWRRTKAINPQTFDVAQGTSYALTRADTRTPVLVEVP